MKVLVCALFVVGLLGDSAKTQESVPIDVFKQAAEKWEGDVPCLKPDCECAFRGLGCCCINSELQTLDDQVIQTFKDVSSNINQMKDEIITLIEPVNVAFTAYLGGKIQCYGPFSRNTTIPYDIIPLNEGSGYNSMLGLFTAPVSGVYSFSLSVYSRLHRAGDRMYHKVQLMRNGQPEVSIWEDNEEDSEDSSSHTVLLSMEQGDQVYAELVEDRQICGNIQGLNSFSGYLVYPLPSISA